MELIFLPVDHANCDWFVCVKYGGINGDFRITGDEEYNSVVCSERWGYFGNCGMCKYGYGWWWNWGWATYCCSSGDSGCKCPPGKTPEAK